MNNTIETIKHIEETQTKTITQVVKIMGELHNLYKDLNALNGQLHALNVIAQAETNNSVLLNTINFKEI